MTIPDSQKVTNQELEQLHKTWCDLVGRQNTWLEHVFPFAMLRRTPVNLEDIYVVPQLVREKLRQNQGKEIENGHEREIIDKIMEEYLFKNKIELTLKEALFNANHMVILGKPGGGKTLLLQYIALKASTNPGVLGINRLLPVLVPLREYSGKVTLKEFIFHCIKDQLDHMPEDVFEIFLERNLFIFLFDGLHEVVSKSERVEVSRHIEKFMALYPRTRMVVTSRPSGYKAASIEAIPHYTIAEFSDKEIEEFLEKWIAFQGKNGEFKNSGENFQLISIKKEWIQELVRNPHLLTILAFIHRKGKKSPVKKWEFYQCAVETMMDIVETWKTHTERVIPHRDILIAVLEKVGFNLHSEELSYCDDEKLHMWLKEALDDIQGHSSRREIDDIISILKEVGFLTEKKQGLYRITHVTFQESLAAQYVSKRKDIYNLITKKLYSSHWREVFLLSAAIAPPQQADMIFDSILQAENDFEDYIHSNLLFAGEALAEQGRLNESKRNNIIQRLKGLINSGCSELRLDALQTLMKMGDVFDSKDIKELLSHEWYIRYLAVRYAMTRAGDTEMKKIIFALLNDKDWRVLREVIKYFTVIKATNTGIKEKIKELLRNNHPRIRKEGIRYFAQMGIRDTEVQKTIFALLRDENPDVCGGAVKYFTLLDEDIKIRRKFFELLKDDDLYVRYLALTYFTAIHGNSEIKKKFLELLKDDDSYVRYLALKYFTAKNIEIAENISDFLRDTDRRIRGQAFEYLTTIGDINNAENIFELLKDTDRRIRNQTLEYLTTKENPEIKNKVFKLLSNEYSYVREQAVKYFTITRAKDTHIKKKIFELLNDEPDTRYFAVEYQATIGAGDTDIEENLFEFLSDKDWRIRYVAVEFFATTGNGNPEVKEKILALLKDEDPDVRYRAVRYFTAIEARDTRIKKEICELLKDDYSYIRYRVVEYFTTIGMSDTEIKDILVPLLKDEDSGVRCLSAEYVTRKGYKDTETKNNVFELLKDEDSDVREQAVRYVIIRGIENPEIKKFLELLDNRNPDVRCCALRCLKTTKTENPEVKKKIFALLSDESYSTFLDRKVQDLALDYLSRYAQKESVSGLLLFTSRDESTRRGAYNLMKALAAQ